MAKPASAIFDDSAVIDAAKDAKRGRGADADRRAAILDCAEQVFLEDGFQAASMSAIAAKLGGSKGTLYNYFPSKEELFLACVSRHCEGLQAQMESVLSESGDVREALTGMGRRYLEVVTSDDVVRKFRMVVAEAERSPEVAAAFYDVGPRSGAKMVARYIEEAMAQGVLASSDPVRAAQAFLGLCSNWHSKARLCNVSSAPDRARIAEDVDEAVRIFLAAYGVPAAGKTT